MYTGITIGPIYDTLNSVTKPAGLWGGSFLFSYIAKNLCLKLYKEGVNECDFISPYFEIDGSGNIDSPKNGIGFFHDRIIFKTNSINIEKVKNIIEDLKEEIGDKLIKSLSNEINNFSKLKVKEFVKNYLQIYAIEYEVCENFNPILKLSPFLDSLELEKSYNLKQRLNYFLTVFDNSSIKNCCLIDDFKDFKNSPISDEKTYSDKIKSVDDIAKGNNKKIDMKKYYYYAIVKADGDNMGKILNSITKNENIKNFSKACFKYAKDATEKIKDFGAVTIYAGGDDLLFISPLENEKKETIFDLVLDIEKSFMKYFDIEGYKKFKPSLSFGISINFKSYPLYEAFEKANELLFEVSKLEENKNTTAIEIQKHSGKSISLIINNTKPKAKEVLESENESYEILRNIFKKYNNDSDDFLRSVGKKLYQFKLLFQKAIKEEDREKILENLFKNTFDHRVQKENEEYVNEVKKLLIDISKSKTIKTLEKDEEEKIILTMDSALRMLKFFTEKGKEGQNNG